MNESLDVRLAIREANGVFQRYPMRICLPMVLMALVAYAVQPLLEPPARLAWLKLMFFLPASYCLSSFLEVFIATMYLRAKQGVKPRGSQLGKVAQYDGFAGLLLGLFFRYFGWSLLLGATLGFVLLLVPTAVILAIPGIAGASASASVHWITWTFLAIAVIVFAGATSAVLSRYIFVLPMFAITSASCRGFLDRCVHLTLRVWKTATLIMLIGSLPAAAPALADLPVWKHAPLPQAVRIASESAVVVLVGCYSAWFILVKTGLALQLWFAPEPVPNEKPAQPPSELPAC